jgi:hypothetical protein
LVFCFNLSAVAISAAVDFTTETVDVAGFDVDEAAAIGFAAVEVLAVDAEEVLVVVSVDDPVAEGAATFVVGVGFAADVSLTTDLTATAVGFAGVDTTGVDVGAGFCVKFVGLEEFVDNLFTGDAFVGDVEGEDEVGFGTVGDAVEAEALTGFVATEGVVLVVILGLPADVGDDEVGAVDFGAVEVTGFAVADA